MKIAVMIVNMGGPDSLEAVEPYLYNIFKDPDIIDIPLPEFLRRRFVRWLSGRRAPKSREIYAKIGGRSPLNDITDQQALLLEKALNNCDKATFRVFTAMRYWFPLVEDVWQKICSQGFEKLIVVSLYPFYSTTTAGSLEKLIQRLNKAGDYPLENLQFIGSFGNHPLFIKAMIEQIRTSLSGKEQNLLFSAHSIPMRRIKGGDPYQQEIEQAVKQISEQLPSGIRVHLSYQSKVGPIAWLGPATADAIKTLAKNKVKDLLVYPLGFVSDNSETIYEIDILYKDLAFAAGMTTFTKIDALNDDPLFIDALKNIVMERCE
jgi:ferrochelatase